MLIINLAVSRKAVFWMVLFCSLFASCARIVVTHEISEMQDPGKDGGSADPVSDPVAQSDGEDGENDCLSCHGPFEQLASAQPNFAVSESSKINPHRYVPHDSKEIPDCTVCHETHPVPPAEPVKKPTSVGWCYNTCHHLYDFTACTECH